MKQPFSPMDHALDAARQAGVLGEVPVGAVITNSAGEIIVSAGNAMRANCDPSAHAEVLAIRAACAKIGSERLIGYNLYVTLEPCIFCAGIISAARIMRLYYGASDLKSGGIECGARVFDRAQAHHKPEIYSGIGETEAAKLLRDFFAKRRGSCAENS